MRTIFSIGVVILCVILAPYTSVFANTATVVIEMTDAGSPYPRFEIECSLRTAEPTVDSDDELKQPFFYTVEGRNGIASWEVPEVADPDYNSIQCYSESLFNNCKYPSSGFTEEINNIEEGETYRLSFEILTDTTNPECVSNDLVSYARNIPINSNIQDEPISAPSNGVYRSVDVTTMAIVIILTILGVLGLGAYIYKDHLSTFYTAD